MLPTLLEVFRTSRSAECEERAFVLTAVGVPNVVDFDGINLRIVHYCLDNDIRYDSSVSLDRFKDSKGALDDVNESVAFAAHAALRALTGQDLPASKRAWEEWSKAQGS